MDTLDLTANRQPVEDMLSRPLPLCLAKPKWLGSDCDHFVIFTEPPKAPGLSEVLPKLRKGVKRARKADRKSQRYSALAGHGLQRKHGTMSACVQEEDGSWSQGFQYRLIACSHDIDPIGYCTFGISLDYENGCVVAVNEIWVEPEWRGNGVGSGFAQVVATIVLSTLEEFDMRLAGTLPHAVSIPILIEGDVYSISGKDFLDAIQFAMYDFANDVSWMTYAGLEIEVDARW